MNSPARFLLLLALTIASWMVVLGGAYVLMQVVLIAKAAL